MRVSNLFGKTSKTEGIDYKIDSHRLLTQAGFIRESTAGRYYFLPLGIAVQNKIINVVRKHMNLAGGQEIITPILHPHELWAETGRSDTGDLPLMHIKDRRNGEFILGGTAEEMVTDLVRKFNISYRDLPFTLYQFSAKFRDELRARGGLLRVREFIMKDAYSYGTEAQFKNTYDVMWDAYSAIFHELGLKTDVVAADNGYIGGDYCHEFVAEASVGESRYFIDKKSGYAAHEDVATFKIEDKNLNESLRDLEVYAEAKRGTTMEDGVKLHGLPLWQQIKDVLYFDETTKKYVLAIIRGDFDVNETKLMQLTGTWNLRAATHEEVREDLESEPGFISPVGFAKKGKNTGYPVVIVADKSLRTARNMYGGANKNFTDMKNLNIDRDFKADLEGDIALARAGYISPDGGKLVEKRGIEVGNIFQLGYHYTNLMQGAEYTDEKGERQKYYMGCYGIGIGRTMAAIVEAHHDEKGIIWPESIAPAKVYLASLGSKPETIKAADELYKTLLKNDIEVLYDDRDARPGEKFADADLLGIPYRVVVSDKLVANKQLELKARISKEVEILHLDQLLARLTK